MLLPLVGCLLFTGFGALLVCVVFCVLLPRLGFLKFLLFLIWWMGFCYNMMFLPLVDLVRYSWFVGFKLWAIGLLSGLLVTYW